MPFECFSASTAAASKSPSLLSPAIAVPLDALTGLVRCILPFPYEMILFIPRCCFASAASSL